MAWTLGRTRRRRKSRKRSILESISAHKSGFNLQHSLMTLRLGARAFNESSRRNACLVPSLAPRLKSLDGGIIDGVKRRYMAPVWNFTVANLTLMARWGSRARARARGVQILIFIGKVETPRFMLSTSSWWALHEPCPSTIRPLVRRPRRSCCPLSSCWAIGPIASLP